VKPNINLVEVHPQLSNNKHLVDGALVGSSSLFPFALRFSLTRLGQAKSYIGTVNQQVSIGLKLCMIIT
jgi:hypothetical protein